MQLNPNYSPVFRVPAFLNAYAEGKYVEALDLEVRIKCQDFSTLTPCELQRSGKLMGEETSLRKCIRPLMEISSPGHDELRACLSL